VRRNYLVYAGDLPHVSCQETQDVIREGGGRYFDLDVSSQPDWENAVATIREDAGKLDLLVNSAGTLVVGRAQEVKAEHWQRVLDVNLGGTIRGCQNCFELLHASQGRPAVINVASCAAFLPLMWSSAYNASKAGVLAFSETIASEWSPFGIHVTAVCPGIFRSRLFESSPPMEPSMAEMLEWMVKKSGLSPDQVAQAAIAAAERRRPIVVAPIRVWRWWFMKRLFPRDTNRFVSAVGWRLYRKFSTAATGAKP
jgi:NAD(P)-dependent dehydrogenase (short-subunit alcohol dehydrogenase family)